MEKSLAFINDKFVNLTEKVLPLEERALQFGDSVYEVIRVYNGMPFTLIDHINRLYYSAESILLNISISSMELISIVKEGINHLNMNSGTVYIQVTRGNADRNHEFPKNSKENIILIWKTDEFRSLIDTLKGVSLITVPDERWNNCFIKSSCLLPNVLAKEKAVRSGFYEALFIRNGEIKECSAMNIFLVKDGIIKTPPADQSILNGITRKKVIEIAKKANYSISEIKLTIDDLETADEIFITSTTKEIVPVIKIDNFMIGSGEPGNTYKDIHLLFKKYIESECSNSKKTEIRK